MANRLDPKLNTLVKRTVLESLEGFLGDPDYGLDLRESVKRRLKKYQTQPIRGGLNLTQVRRQYL